MLTFIFPIAAFLTASLFAAVLGLTGTRAIESAGIDAAAIVLGAGGHSWAQSAADGLMIEVSGLAPDPEAHQAALLTLQDRFGRENVRDASRIRPDIQSDSLSPVIRLQEADGSVILFGAVPGEESGRLLTDAAKDALPDQLSTIMLHTLPGDSGPGMSAAVDFALAAIVLPQVSLVEAAADTVSITGMTESEESAQRLRRQIDRMKPAGVDVNYSLTSLPPPAVSPFALHLELGHAEARFTVCDVESVADRERLLTAASVGGRAVSGLCRLADGAPDAAWADAAEAAVSAAAAAGGGLITAEDREFRIRPSDAASFDSLQASGLPEMPAGYSVSLSAPAGSRITDEAADHTLTITKGSDGHIQFSGAFSDETARRIAVLSAWVTLDASHVEDSTIVDPGIAHPDDDDIRFAGEALKPLHNGTASISGDRVRITGVTDDPHATEQIAELLSRGFAEGEFSLDITYDSSINAPPPPMDPRLCVQLLNETQKQTKITFEPGSARITANALDTIDQMVEVLRGCRHVPIEFAGHTDNQGRETMNQRLSERRARAVLNAVLDAGLVPKNISAVGYGESQPIADNATAEGRRANRRIEFRLMDDQISAPQ